MRDEDSVVHRLGLLEKRLQYEKKGTLTIKGFLGTWEAYVR